MRTWPIALVALVPVVLFAPVAAARASQTLGAPTQVVCIGTACGGGGGSGAPCPFLYRVKPNGKDVRVFEVGVEDGDSSHYSNFCVPQGWTHSFVPLQRPHDLCSTVHGQVTDSNSNCPFVLRFENQTTPLAGNSEFGFSYALPTDGFHDAHWRTDGQLTSRQASWDFTLGTNSGPVHSPVPRRQKTNILVIVLDDLSTDRLTLFDGPHVPPNPHELARTPRLDALAAEGIRFTNFYVNPVCSPTRSTVLSGRYPFDTGMGTNAEALPLPDDEVLVSELLTDGFDPGEGYRCGAFGKWHLARINGPIQPAPDWGHACRNGFDRFFGVLTNVGTLGGNHFTWYKTEHDPGLGIATNAWVSGWQADVVRADAVEWINAQNQPFFAYVAFNPPHAPWQVPPHETQDGRPLLHPDTITALGPAAPPGTTPTPGAQSHLFYRAAIEAVDAEIGYLIDDICAEQLQNTMIFILGDNGPNSAVIPSPHDPDRGKGTVYQLGVNTPLIVKGPLVPPGGHTCDRLVGAVDLWSTIADISGANVSMALAGRPPRADSVSFRSLIVNPLDAEVKPWAFSQSFAPPGVYTSVSQLESHKRCITDGRYKYIRTITNHTIGAPVSYGDYTHELYDIVTDPDETNDLLLVPPYILPPAFLFLRSELERISER